MTSFGFGSNWHSIQFFLYSEKQYYSLMSCVQCTFQVIAECEFYRNLKWGSNCENLTPLNTLHLIITESNQGKISPNIKFLLKRLKEYNVYLCLTLFNFYLVECYDYRKLESADRKITHKKGKKCDNMGEFSSGWYRFEGAAGTRMATSCTPQNRCDTSATSWLNGTHPTLTEGQVSRRVCFSYHGNCFWESTDIKVRNCGSYYVYYFKWVPLCNARYCGIDD